MVSKLNLYLNKLINPSMVIVLAALARLVPHMPNFAPIGAMALFGGAYMNKKWAIILPLSAMFVSDIFIGFDSIPSRIAVYGSFILIGFVGLWLKNHKSFGNIICASLASSIIFFLITNFEVWAAGAYSRDISGLWQSYLMGIPFFRGTLFGDLFYTGVFFGGYELALRFVKNRQLNLVREEV